jgi:hypothetical protein
VGSEMCIRDRLKIGWLHHSSGSFRVSGSSRAKRRAFLHLLVGAPCEKTYALVWQDNGRVLPQKRFNNVAHFFYIQLWLAVLCQSIYTREIH